MSVLGAALVLLLACSTSVAVEIQKAPFRMHTLFSVECQNYYDWQTVGLIHSCRKAGQPGPITRLLSCTEDEKKVYKGMDLAPTMEVPSMSRHPKTADWYPAINKPAGIVHWLKYSKDAENVDWVVILDAYMIIRGPIIPWEVGAEKGKPFAALYGYLVGCDNILARLHTNHSELCDKVGGMLVMHIDDLRALAPLWLSKTEEVRADRDHWATNITGDIYGQGWISEMYGYSFGASEAGLRHKISEDLMIYPGYTPRPDVEPILMHYGLRFEVGNWSFSKLDHHDDPIVYKCNRLFPKPPFPREGFEEAAGRRTLKQEIDHSHEVHCSRERSRAAWKIIEEYLMPFVEQEEYKLSSKCKLHPDNDMFREQEQHKVNLDYNEWKCGFCKKSFFEEKFLDKHLDSRHYNLLNNTKGRCLADLCGALHCDEVIETKRPKTKCTHAAAAKNHHLCESLADSCFPITQGDSASRLHELFLRQFCDAHTCTGAQKPFAKGGRKETNVFYLAICILTVLLLPLFYVIVYLQRSGTKKGTLDLKRISKASCKRKPS